MYLCTCQAETEAGAAGEQPVRDKFDLYSFIKTGLSFRQFFFIKLVVLCLKKLIYKSHFPCFRQSIMISQFVFQIGKLTI